MTTSTPTEPPAPTAATADTAPTATGKLGTRDRLLQAASELFYREGTVAVGVDRICQQAQVSKRSMYQLFSTKDELVAAALQVTGDTLGPQYLPTEEDSRSPREQILSIFAWLDLISTMPDYGGCPFVNTATELKDADHPAALVAREYKQQMTDVFEREARAAGAADPALLAQQLTIIFDGCGSRVVMTGRALNGLAVATATVLIDSAF